jgi:hypothetical protein
MGDGPHGVSETNPIDESGHKLREEVHENYIIVEWTDPRLAKIERLRLLSDPGFPMWDVSYCYGRLRDGTAVKVDLPFDQLRKNRKINAQIVAYAQRDGVYAKGLGIFNAISTLSYLYP